MKLKRIIGLGLVGLAALTVLAACRSNSSSSSSNSQERTAIVTDTGGVNDKSFNQSAWEGLKAWGESNNLKENTDFKYFQSNKDADYANNIDSAVKAGFKLVFGVGYKLQQAVTDGAKTNSDTNFVLIDSVVEGNPKNVVSATFADNEAAYLAGVAAAKTTKTNHVGFIGGMDSDVITRFRVGFEAGVRSVDPNIKVDSQLANSFTDAGKGQTLASSMYESGADVIYQAAGGAGSGVITEAKNRNQAKDEADKVWVIGVDRDQNDEGNYTSKDGKKSNFILASSIKGVGQVVKDMANKNKAGKFPGGSIQAYNLKNKGVDLTTTHLSQEAKSAVADAKAQIIDGQVVVPEK